MYRKLCVGLMSGLFFLTDFVFAENATEEKNTESSFEERLGKMQFDEEKYPIPEIVLGKSDAKYTLMIYSSFSCSHCRMLHKILPQFIREHVDNGDVRLTLRFYVDDPAAFEAAMLVVHFGKNDSHKMLELMNLVYDNQEQWMKSREQPKFLRKLFADFMQKRDPKDENYWYQQANDLLTMPNKENPEIEKISQRINARLMHGHQYAVKMHIFSVPAFLFNVRTDENSRVIHGKIHEGIIDELWDECKKNDVDVGRKFLQSN